MTAQRPQTAGPWRVALVCMPFYLVDRPSIQLGLLKAEARAAGFMADSYHLNLELAARLTPLLYHRLCLSPRAFSLGEWLFSRAAFGEEVSPDDDSYFKAFPELGPWARDVLGKDLAWLSMLRHELIPSFIADCLHMAEWGGYDVVGFSSTFQQNAASLALAQRIKQEFPRAAIVFGGANMEGEMGPEFARAFPGIDYVVVGEADESFPALLQALAEKRSPADLPGVVSRSAEKLNYAGQAPPVTALDSLPPPEYSEFFERASRLGLSAAPGFSVTLPFESSRGCWWGKKSHCMFCGLNGLAMDFRRKAPDRVLSELAALAARHRVTFFQATDNILDPQYLESVFARVKADKLDYHFFYELKAVLSREQIRALYQGGVRWVEPGIESLSTRVLKLMRKGTTMLQNVNILRWLRYHRIRVSWSLLWGFAGETIEDYQGQLAVARLITHLSPPVWWGRIWLERFSPYFMEKDRFPVRDVRPIASYSHVYPARLDLGRAAYFFDYSMPDAVPDQAMAQLSEHLKQWQRKWNQGKPDSLTFRRVPGSLFIDDNREGRRETLAFHGPMAAVYEFCVDSPRAFSEIQAHVESLHPRFAKTRASLQFFLDQGLMLSERDQFLSLALPANPNW